jgi:hypothetical protein
MQRLSEQIYTSRAKQRLRLLNLYLEKFNEAYPMPRPLGEVSPRPFENIPRIAQP